MSPKERLDAQRRAQLAADRALLGDLTREYAKTFKSVRRELAQLTKQIAEARARGETVNPAWLFQRARLDRFERELGAELVMYLDLAKRKIEAASVQALIDGQTDARALLAQTLPPGISPVPALPLEQLKGFVTQSATGTPLGNLLAGLGTQAAQEARSVLIEGVALGLGTREIGRNLTAAFAGNANRALLVARTEVIRAYRDAALRTYRQNHSVVKGWVWIAQLGSRTCPVCIAKHGSFHSLEEDFGSHPACRCSPAPASRDWAELGIDAPETKIDPEKGEAWFARQPAEVQRSILGPGKYRLYADGEIKLDDLVQETVHPVWGKGLRERPLKALVSARATPAAPPAPTLPEIAPAEDIIRDAVRFGTPNEYSLRARGYHSAADYQRKTEERMLEELSDKRVAIRSTPEIAERILEDGRFKTQFETGTSGGLLDEEVRRHAESRLFGFASDMPDAERPIYGFVQGISTNSVEMYGNVEWVLKDAVRQRATITGMDSLSLQVPPSRMTAPRFYSAKSVEDDRGMFAWTSTYWEAQVHGGVSLDDVDEVIIRVAQTATPFEHGQAERLRDALEQRGVRARIETPRSLYGPGPR